MAELHHRYLVAPGSPPDLAQLDPRERVLHPELDKDTSLPVLEDLLERIKQLQHRLYAESRKGLLVVVQAMDCGGKDGVARHIFGRLDPQGIDVIPFKRPTEEELAHDFLWRIHKAVPRKGRIVVFNRSYYEDIIAVRVKRLFPDEVWQRRHRLVEDFEHLLFSEGTAIVKIFLHISREEQKKRLQARLDDPQKHWKFEPGDIEDRRRWDQFQEAYQDLIGRTSTPEAPWFTVPADRKWYRNLVVARIVLEQLEKLDPQFPGPDGFNPATVVIPD